MLIDNKWRQISVYLSSTKLILMLKGINRKIILSKSQLIIVKYINRQIIESHSPLTNKEIIYIRKAPENKMYNIRLKVGILTWLICEVTCDMFLISPGSRLNGKHEYWQEVQYSAQKLKIFCFMKWAQCSGIRWEEPLGISKRKTSLSIGTQRLVLSTFLQLLHICRSIIELWTEHSFNLL